MNRKGEQIRVEGGIYVGKTGWFDNEGSHTHKMFAVIINQVTNKKGVVVDKATKIGRRNVAPFIVPKPASYPEAIMQQHPKIEQLMAKLCRDLAMCEIDPEEVEIQSYFLPTSKKPLPNKVRRAAMPFGSKSYTHKRLVIHSTFDLFQL